MLRFGGDKYENGAGGVLASSTEQNWNGLHVELRAHRGLKLPSFVQCNTEVALLVSGRGTVVRRAKGTVQRTEARPGALWLCPAQTPVDFLDSSSEGEAEVLHLYIGQNLFADGEDDDRSSPQAANLRYLAGFKDVLVEQIGRAILAELNSQTSSGRLLVETLGRSLAARLIHSYSRASSLSPSDIGSKGLDRRRLARVVDFVEANLHDDLKIDDLAAIACLSPSHFARAFKVSIGLAPHQYVSARRLERAKRWLASGGLSLAEIALQLNFSTQASFTKAFQRSTGSPPGQYRDRVAPTRR
jgi:AraC family transcriptional regulator